MEVRLTKKKLIIGVFLLFFFILYAFFWSFIFKNRNGFFASDNQKVDTNTKLSLSLFPQEEDSKNILGTSDSTANETFPDSLIIDIAPRQQKFNLSCEFAAASAIIYHYTKNAAFAPQNQESAEKTLISEIGVSQNPNVGIRMGVTAKDQEALYKNLNQRFGGIEYYGVHAPPFIDLFPKYTLSAKPVQRSSTIIQRIQKAISSSHLLMGWIRIGYGKPVDVALSYGSIPIIKGEHTVVIYGYDTKGVLVMDPGNASKRHIRYEDFLQAIELFPLPLLEIFPSKETASLEDIVFLESPTGLIRNNISIVVENGSSEIGKGTELAEILQDFGYKVTAIKNAANGDTSGLTLTIKQSKADYLYILEKDLAISSYKIASASSDREENAKEDVVITVGSE